MCQRPSFIYFYIYVFTSTTITAPLYYSLLPGVLDPTQSHTTGKPNYNKTANAGNRVVCVLCVCARVSPPHVFLCLHNVARRPQPPPPSTLTTAPKPDMDIAVRLAERAFGGSRLNGYMQYYVNVYTLFKCEKVARPASDERRSCNETFTSTHTSTAQHTPTRACERTSENAAPTSKHTTLRHSGVGLARARLRN